MKKIITILAFCTLLSCSEEKDGADLSTDAAVIKLMKTPDKSTLSKAELKTIVKYLDKKPEDSKYLMTDGILKDTSAVNSNLKNSAKIAEYTMADYMQIMVLPSNSPDFKASVDMSNFGAGRIKITYVWTILSNAAGLFDVFSQENFIVTDSGPLAPYLKQYTIEQSNHVGSFIKGNSGPIGWVQTNYSFVPGDYSAYIFVGGDLKGPSNMRVTVSANRFVNITQMVNTNGLITGNY